MINCSYFSMMRRLKSMGTWLSFFTMSKTLCLCILLSASLVQPKTITRPVKKLQLKASTMFKRGLINVAQTYIETVKPVVVNVRNICGSRFYASILNENPDHDLIALSDNDIYEKLISNILTSISNDYSNLKIERNSKSRSGVLDLLEKNGFLSKPKLYTPDHKDYDQIWDSFTWKNWKNGFETAKKALDFIKGIYPIVPTPDQIILEQFFTQTLYFDNNPKSNSLDTNFSKDILIPQYTSLLKPREMSTTEAIEEAQNVVAWVRNKFTLRMLFVSTLNLVKCRSIKSSSNFTVKLVHLERVSRRPTTKMPVRASTRTTAGMTVARGVVNRVTTADPQENTICGEPIQRARIVGGRVAAKGSWPWLAAVMMGDIQICGGVLISEDYVLSAGHCVDDLPAPENLQVRLGEHDFSKGEESDRLICEVEKTILHESYNRKTYANDISLIKLKEKVFFNNDHLPICLPPPNMTLVGMNALIAGWGHTSFEGKGNKILMEATLPIWENAKCQATLGSTIRETQLCAGYQQGGIDACQGDSGGPLMYKTTSGRWVTVGVISWGMKCAEKDKPGVYTRVSAYLNWIRAKLLQ